MPMFHDITKMSLGGLKAMQRAIYDRLAQEDAMPAGKQKTYGVREHQDWKDQADEMEAELNSRKEVYTKIPW